MDLTATPEDVAFRDQVRAWLEANAPREVTTLEERKAWAPKLYEAGYLGMAWPKAYGGRDARPMEQAIVADELARINAPPATIGLGVSIVGHTIIVHGTEEQKRRFLAKILSHEEIWCQLYSEPNAGSDLASLKTKAEDNGDHYLVNGQKVWTSSGMLADWGLLLARTDPNVSKHQGISCFLINMRQPGIEVRPLVQITGGAEFAEVFMTNARVEKDRLVGQINQGWKIAQTTLGYERGGNTLGRITRFRAAFNQLVEVAKRLKRNGHKAIDDPLVRQKLGRIYAELEVARYGALRILTKLEKGAHPGPESSLDKLNVTEFDKRYQELVQEILGPYGQLTEGLPGELPLEVTATNGVSGTFAYLFLWSRAGTIYAGSSEIQKNIIGERVLGLPKEVRADRLPRKSG